MSDQSALPQDRASDRNPDYRDLPPINDLLLVLHLLMRGDQTRATLHTNPHLTKQPYIEFAIYGGGDRHEEYSNSEYYPVTAEVVHELKQKGYVEGQKHWGWTDEHECLIRSHGERVYWMMCQSFADEVKEYLAREHPGVFYERKTAWPALGSMRYHRFTDFYIALDINEAQDEVRRMRGKFSLVLRKKQNAE